MKQSMKAAVLHGLGDLRVQEVPVPGIGPDDVLVKVKAVGVCGSDVHYYTRGRIGRYVVREPMILGHECAGEVVKTGESVRNVAIGDRVAIEPGIPCRRCHFCKSGRYNLCPDVVFLATPPIDGAFSEYVASASDFVYKLPESMTFAEGALIEPLAVGLHAAKRGQVVPGETVVVLGAGTIGLMVLQAVKAYGATRIIAVDLEDNRLELAEKLGAAATINAKGKDVAQEIAALCGPDGVDMVVEAAGTTQTIQLTTKLVRRGGRVVWIGLPGETEIPIDISEVIDKEADIRGVFRYANVYAQAIRLITKGLIDVAALLTHNYTLDNVEEALNLAHTRSDGTIKIIVTP